MRTARLTRVVADLKDADLLGLLALHMAGLQLAPPWRRQQQPKGPVSCGTQDAAAAAEPEAHSGPASPLQGSPQQQQQQQQRLQCSTQPHQSPPPPPRGQGGLVCCPVQPAQSDASRPVKWVALGKHLCGAATDFAFRSCLNALLLQETAQQQQQQQHEPQQDVWHRHCHEAAAANGGADKQLRTRTEADQLAVAGQATAAAAQGKAAHSFPLSGVALATCCHHRCGWEAFCGKAALQAHGIGRREFEAIAYASSACAAPKKEKNCCVTSSTCAAPALYKRRARCMRLHPLRFSVQGLGQ
jgi:tRNA:m4X modification enzyme